MEMGIGRLDLDKPETGPSEDVCTWTKVPGGDWALDSDITEPKVHCRPYSLALLREGGPGLDQDK